MNKFKRRTVAITAGLFLSLSTLCGVLSFNKKVESAEAIGNYSTDASTYYNGITATSGKQLAAQLHDLITSTHRYYTSYADNGANGYQKQTDQYYENGSKVNGYIYEFYSGVKWPNGWYPDSGDTRGGYNREHCWCQSNSVNAGGTQMWGESGGGADMHHLRPVEARLNSARNNHPYGEVTNRDSKKSYAKLGTNQTYAHGGYTDATNDVFEPLDSKKGDVARIILYTYIHYNSYKVSDVFGSYGTTNGNGTSSYFSTSLLSLTKTTNKSTESAALTMLLDWNTSDPVDDIERRRNEQVATYQGNRNPFIDDSTYADKIWGSGTPTPTVNSVSVSPSTLNLDLNGTTTGSLTATVTVSNGAPTTVNWTSSNTNVATVSSSGVVTAVAKGTCTITATSTYNSNKTDSCTVKVVNTGGGGGGGSETVTGDFTWNLAIASYDSNPTANLVTWSHDYATMESIRTDNSRTAANNYLGGDANSRTSSRFYTGNTLTITPATDYTITSIEFTATGTTYASALQTSTWANASASVSNTLVTVTPTDGSNAISALIGGTCGFTAVKVYYSTETSGGVSPLTSISLNTSNVQTEFYVGATFDYSGLVVTAYYENGTEDIVTPSSVSSPNMSTAGNKTVTVTYSENNVTKTATYTISVLSADITAIYASVNKTFHPGERITTSDIYVEDNLGNEVTGFEFGDDGYVFTYNDAPSGGSESEKTFEDSVSYSSFTCNLEVTVSRVAYVTPLTKDDTMTRSWTGVNSTQYTAWSNKTGTSGATYAGKSAKYSSNASDAIQLRSSGSDCGIVTTAYSGSLYISSVTVTWNSGTADDRTLNIYGDTEAYTAASELYGNSPKGTLLGTIVFGTSTSLTITGSYQYIGIKSASSALYLDQIVVTYGTPQSANNVSNYIMYEDTNAQCTTKFGTAKGYFEDLSTSERNTFMTSDDYVISTARTRLEAWARYHGKVITTADGDYVITDARNPVLNIVLNANNNTILIVIVVTTISLLSIGGYFFLKKKKEI